jgi:hypothetical protein
VAIQDSGAGVTNFIRAGQVAVGDGSGGLVGVDPATLNNAWSKIQKANQAITGATNYANASGCQITLAPGTYWCASLEIVRGSSGGIAKTRLNFTGAATSLAGASVRTAFSSAPTENGLTPSLYAQDSGPPVDYNTEEETIGNVQAAVVERRFILQVTTAGVLSIQAATTDPTQTATIARGAYLLARPTQ